MKLLDAVVLMKVFKVSSIFLFAAHFLLLLDLVNPIRIGKSIHFPQVADLRWRHYNRGHEVAESCRKVVYRQQIAVFDLAEEHDKDRLSSDK